MDPCGPVRATCPGELTAQFPYLRGEGTVTPILQGCLERTCVLKVLSPEISVLEALQNRVLFSGDIVPEQDRLSKTQQAKH